MRVQIYLGLHYSFTHPNTVMLAVEAAKMEGQLVEDESLLVGNAALNRIAGDDGVGERIWARVPEHEMVLDYSATVDITRENIPLAGLKATALHDLPAEVVPYLRPSRYCQSDKFVSYVKDRFGAYQGGDKVAAIRDWIEGNLSYVPGSSDADTNVLETFAGRQGVCRDYAHLMCSMVRAAQIPARMVACYGPDVTPQDLHAVAEVWLDGRWHLVDATGMCDPASMVIIAVGRDAYDVAFMDSQAPATMLFQTVQVRRV